MIVDVLDRPADWSAEKLAAMLREAARLAIVKNPTEHVDLSAVVGDEPSAALARQFLSLWRGMVSLHDQGVPAERCQEAVALVYERMIVDLVRQHPSRAWEIWDAALKRTGHFLNEVWGPDWQERLDQMDPAGASHMVA